MNKLRVSDHLIILPQLKTLTVKQSDSKAKASRTNSTLKIPDINHP